ncbi:FAD-dependent oxidoreductase [Thermomonas sp.]|jgi:D-amino-acid dehydrogenase|uniref:FAD-dependent oxidoreductase n=1 Tax=Thermomonas sp. TaxID=1971895 RepID=UPI002397B1F3|nr:FAD-dependent oxidoreductase [Thermomonas sp.]MBS0459135.1 FAD-dependent oxidoreductase [Pseudomonadota bacterium]MDE2380843.1 FAD-dependent oxidoreductase [Xanthomonadaceae bacterium]HOC10357.1 FAD-dependent oxidoreductase [Thermomonas sp.]HQA01658.1 FAD-dependent oxidoreductase [Thermomonas sp.]HQE07599.1 FAD-dependent oxidoreductase [Thermomonas sp.]
MPTANPTTDPERIVDVAVLGAGVVGISTAYALARRGRQVALIERGQGPALGASFANGAQLSYAYTDAMAAPALWKQLPGMLLGRDAAFRTRASADPHYWRWGLAFLRNATAHRLERNTLATLALALESRAAMAELLARHPIAFDHTAPGKLHVYYDAAALPKARAMIAAKHQFGVRQNVLTPAQAIAIEPALIAARDMAFVVHSPEEEVGDPFKFSSQLLHLLCAEYGVEPYFDVAVHGLHRTPEGWHLQAANGLHLRAKKIALCAGIDSHGLLRQLGIRSPLMAVKGYSFTAPCGAQAPAASITDTARKLVFCKLGNSIRVAGLADLNHWDSTPDPQRFAQLLAMAQASLPQAAEYAQVASPWAGLRPVTPHSSPVIARAQPGLVLNIGHGMLGWTLAMGSGERAARLVLHAP